ncbi:MAG: hypothetical protein JO287_25575 [Pseudonocardiales bacterium]|nr:hypothetical protein [Pseudonocardiales bacterium]
MDQVAFELALHADAEERVRYPAMAQAGETSETDEARKEHQQDAAHAGHHQRARCCASRARSSHGTCAAPESRS